MDFDKKQEKRRKKIKNGRKLMLFNTENIKIIKKIEKAIVICQKILYNVRWVKKIT